MSTPSSIVGEQYSTGSLASRNVMFPLDAFLGRHLGSVLAGRQTRAVWPRYWIEIDEERVGPAATGRPREARGWDRGRHGVPSPASPGQGGRGKLIAWHIVGRSSRHDYLQRCRPRRGVKQLADDRLAIVSFKDAPCDPGSRRGVPDTGRNRRGRTEKVATGIRPVPCSPAGKRMAACSRAARSRRWPTGRGAVG